jgi:hypothetical protein
MSNCPESPRNSGYKFLRADLLGSSTATAAGLTAHGEAPVLDLCPPD